MVGALQVNFWLALLRRPWAMILGAAYMLYLYRRVIFGALTKPDLQRLLDLSPREVAIFAPLVVLTLLDGRLSVELHPVLGRDASAAMVREHSTAGAHAPRRLRRRPRAMNWTLAIPELVLVGVRPRDPGVRRAAPAGSTLSAPC